MSASFLSSSFQIKSWNLNILRALPLDWSEAVLVCAKDYSVKTELDGKSSTSREPEGIEPIEVSVVDGSDVLKHLPWLYQLYSTTLLQLASQLHGSPLEISGHLQSSININWIKGIGGRYERHVDSNPITGILYASTLESEDGGELVFDTSSGEFRVLPNAGIFWAFNATETPHYVTPLQCETSRISIPMNFYLVGSTQNRPTDLDTYLYDSQNK